ncbi:hypothetical protein FHS27_002026 [Rhodopirellula rubra]|uniref:Uncharacterized protein n=1 Tax=Aporhodopirellula rubra TaxID=980271 RepID=A0A7W5DY37_9BACT|nr:hypothetical protein [Aporhodopirellula rubra]MBB3206218.1 hypothetical protein [Aporhodopirellula rubra]
MATTFRDSTEFVKGEDGAWIGYSRPLDEGFHYYELIIDGAHVPDPNSKYYFGAMRWGSGIEIPAHDRDFYALKNVPHGQVREIYFHSDSTDSERRAFVYTPPGYDRNQEVPPRMRLSSNFFQRVRASTFQNSVIYGLFEDASRYTRHP